LNGGNDKREFERISIKKKKNGKRRSRGHHERVKRVDNSGQLPCLCAEEGKSLVRKAEENIRGQKKKETKSRSQQKENRIQPYQIQGSLPKGAADRGERRCPPMCRRRVDSVNRIQPSQTLQQKRAGIAAGGPLPWREEEV